MFLFTKKTIKIQIDFLSMVVYSFLSNQTTKMIYKKLLSALIILIIANPLLAQKTSQDVSFSTAFGSGQVSTTTQYQYLLKLGKKHKFSIGTGARLTNNFGNLTYYITAPAKLTSGKTGPAVFFADQINANLDSVYFKKSQVNALNITVNFAYDITPKIKVGFNIDAIGFSFGGSKQGSYFPNAGLLPSTVSAKPTGFNLLLVSDNDLGTLNSEFYGQYAIDKHWGAKLGFQFLFTEYTTSTKVQTTPSGLKNDRFRNKAGQISIGASYQF